MRRRAAVEPAGWRLVRTRRIQGFGRCAGATVRCAKLRRLGHRAQAPCPLAPLTAREREFADLVADGRANRAVDEQFVLSTRTIERGNIYGRRGGRSRVELSRKLHTPHACSCGLTAATAHASLRDSVIAGGPSRAPHPRRVATTPELSTSARTGTGECDP
jgi:DNA-binding CsgD family transcriptional regulator